MRDRSASSACILVLLSSSEGRIARTHLEDDDKTDDVGEHRDDEEPRAREDVGDLGEDCEGARRGRPSRTGVRQLAERTVEDRKGERDAQGVHTDEMMPVAMLVAEMPVE